MTNAFLWWYSFLKINALRHNKNRKPFPRPQCLFSSQAHLAVSQTWAQACVPRHRSMTYACAQGHVTHTHTHTDTFPTSSNPILSGYLGTTETNWDGSIGGWSTGRHKKHEGCFVSERLRKQHSTRRPDLSEHNLNVQNVQNVQNEDKCSAFFQDQVATQEPWWSQHWFGEHLFLYRWHYLLHFT